MNKVPKYELVSSTEVDKEDWIKYNGAIINVHKISFTEPVTEDEKAVMHVRYTIIDGSPVEDDKFQKALGDICWDLLEQNSRYRQQKAEDLRDALSGNRKPNT